MSGHLGKKKTKGKLSQRYYWYEMREDLSIWISQCETCEENKPPHKAIRAPLGSMPVGAPFLKDLAFIVSALVTMDRQRTSKTTYYII
jgi:hypothetical protein